MSNPSTLTVCGRVIGTYVGLDDLDDVVSFQVYDFRPADGIALPPAEILTVNFTTGNFEVWTGEPHDDSPPVSTHDIVSILHTIAPAPVTAD